MSKSPSDKSERGQGLTEYVLILALTLVTAITAMELTGYSVREVYCNVAKSLGFEGTCAGKRIYCQDDFENLDKWVTNWGTFTNQDGKMCTSRGAKNYSNCSTQMPNNTDYSVYVSGTELTRGNGYGVFFRGTELDGRTNGYILQYDPGWGGGAIIMRKWINGRELPPFAVKRLPGYDWYGEAHDIRIDVQGNTFTAYLNGEEILVGQDDTYTEGGIGIRSWDNSQTCIDSITVGQLNLSGAQ